MTAPAEWYLAVLHQTNLAHLGMTALCPSPAADNCWLRFPMLLVLPWLKSTESNAAERCMQIAVCLPAMRQR